MQLQQLLMEFFGYLILYDILKRVQDLVCRRPVRELEKGSPNEALNKS